MCMIYIYIYISTYEVTFLFIHLLIHFFMNVYMYLVVDVFASVPKSSYGKPLKARTYSLEFQNTRGPSLRETLLVPRKGGLSESS